MDSLNVWLQITRKAKSLRQIDLALRASLSPATIWKAEHSREISTGSKKKISEALGVYISDIFSFNGSTVPECPDPGIRPEIQA